MWQDAGVPRRDEVTQKGWGFAPSVGFGLGTPTSLTLGYQHLQQNNIPDYGLPGTLPDLAVATGRTVDDLDFSSFYGLLSRDHEKTKSDVATGTIDHRFNRTLSLRNLTRYGRNDSRSRRDVAARGDRGQRRHRSRLQPDDVRRSAAPTRSISTATTGRSRTRPTSRPVS